MEREKSECTFLHTNLAEGFPKRIAAGVFSVCLKTPVTANTYSSTLSLLSEKERAFSSCTPPTGDDSWAARVSLGNSFPRTSATPPCPQSCRSFLRRTSSMSIGHVLRERKGGWRGSLALAENGKLFAYFVISAQRALFALKQFAPLLVVRTIFICLVVFALIFVEE